MTMNDPGEVTAIFPGAENFRADYEFIRVSATKKVFDEIVKLIGKGDRPVLRILGGEVSVVRDMEKAGD